MNNKCYFCNIIWQIYKIINKERCCPICERRLEK